MKIPALNWIPGPGAVHAWLLILMLAGGCAAPAPNPGADTAPAPAALAAEPPAPAPEASAEPPRPVIDLTGDLLFRIMLAEIAGQRGELDLALQTYMELARGTRDVKVAERATRIAVYARNEEAAAEAAAIWVELDPKSPDPHQVLAVMALRRGDQEQAFRHLEQMLDYSTGSLDEKLLMIANLLGREKDGELVLALMERLVAMRQDSPDALYAFSHVVARFGALDRAAQLLEQALRLAPENEKLLLSYVSVLQRQGRTDAALGRIHHVLEQRQKRKEDDFNLRMAYARLLADARRFDEASAQFELLMKAQPDNAEVAFALGLLHLQGNRLDAAEPYFKSLVNSEERGDDASYYLGRIAEQRQQFEQANIWYLGVQGGENYFDAQVRLGLILARQDRLAEARTHLRSVRTRNAEERALLVQAEAEMLTEARRFDEAMSIYDQALQSGYNGDLLYARAMLAEKMDRLDIVERDLRQVLEKDPGNAQALNALGYTLADRTSRFDEAYDLIRRALEISPSDYYILDSMGWVLYRMGRLEEAADYLRKALVLRPDPEIAAHLGEVLWVKGDRNGASDVWSTALRETPGDDRLLDVIKRFKE
jgi:tetratricopeptide (TPR) repeat protein